MQSCTKTERKKKMNENTETVYNDTDPELTDVMVDTDEVELEGEGTEGEDTEAAPIVAIKVDELQGNFDEWHTAGMSEDDIIEKLHTDHELSYPGAVNRLRVLKKGAGLTRPKGAKSEDVRIFIQTCHDEGNERPAIIEKLVEKYGYTKKSAASTFSVQGGKLGLAGGGSFGGGAKKPLAEVVSWVRANADKKRADFSAAMATELGYTPSTAGAFYTYLAFAKEYASQEVAAAS